MAQLAAQRDVGLKKQQQLEAMAMPTKAKAESMDAEEADLKSRLHLLVQPTPALMLTEMAKQAQISQPDPNDPAPMQTFINVSAGFFQQQMQQQMRQRQAQQLMLQQ